MSGKVLVVTGHMQSPGWQKLSDLTLPTKRDYCAIGKPGFGVASFDGEETWNRLCTDDNGRRKWQHTGFARTRAVQKCMTELIRMESGVPEVEFCLWTDTDVALTRQDFDIVAYFNELDSEGVFYCSVDSNGCQSGLFGVRVCPRGLDLLEKVWNAEERFQKNDWHEQGALAYYATQMNCWVVPEKKLFDSYPPNWNEGDFTPGYSWAIHAPARSDEERYEAISSALASVGYTPAP